jgi:hypothetical protein
VSGPRPVSHVEGVPVVPDRGPVVAARDVDPRDGLERGDQSELLTPVAQRFERPA